MLVVYAEVAWGELSCHFLYSSSYTSKNIFSVLMRRHGAHLHDILSEEADDLDRVSQGWNTGTSFEHSVLLYCCCGTNSSSLIHPWKCVLGHCYLDVLASTQLSTAACCFFSHCTIVPARNKAYFQCRRDQPTLKLSLSETHYTCFWLQLGLNLSFCKEINTECVCNCYCSRLAEDTNNLYYLSS